MLQQYHARRKEIEMSGDCADRRSVSLCTGIDYLWEDALPACAAISQMEE